MLEEILDRMNRLTVYSYLTRFGRGGSRGGGQATPAEKGPMGFKMRCWTRQKQIDNYQMLVWLVNGTYSRQLYHLHIMLKNPLV